VGVADGGVENVTFFVFERYWIFNREAVLPVEAVWQLSLSIEQLFGQYL
jgi:hypothetical protein